MTCTAVRGGLGGAARATGGERCDIGSRACAGGGGICLNAAHVSMRHGHQWHGARAWNFCSATCWMELDREWCVDLWPEVGVDSI